LPAAPGHVNNRRVGSFLGQMILCAAALATLLVVGGMEQNPGPGMEGESIIQILYRGCDRILKSGTRCETCGCWYHNYCGNVKAQVAESGKWKCDRCGSERLRLLEEKLQNALLQIDKLKRKNKALEEKLQLVAAEKEAGKLATASVKHEDVK